MVGLDDDGAPGVVEANRTLLVRNLARGVDQQRLEEFLSSAGPVQHAVIVTEKRKALESTADTDATLRSRGFAFVTFSLAEDAKAALSSLQGAKFDGKKIKLTYAHHRQRKRKRDEGADDNDAAWGAAPLDEADAASGASAALDAASLGLPRHKPRPTTPNVIVRNIDEDTVRRKLRGDKFVTAVETVRDGVVKVSFNRFKTARHRIEELHGVRSLHGCSVAAFETELNGRERLIVRNLSFDVTEKMLREKFHVHGPLRDVHVVRHQGKSAGFGFVEYFHAIDMSNAARSANGAVLCGRTIAVDIALPKNRYDQLQKHKQVFDAADASVDSAAGAGVAARETTPRARKAAALAEDGANGSSAHDSADDGGAADVGNDEEEGREGGREVEEDQVNAQADAQSEARGGAQDTKRAKRERCEPRSTAEELERTIFVRNLLFETEQAELSERMAEYGRVQQCVLVRDRTTGRSRGVGFVRFGKVAQARAALDAAEYQPEDSSGRRAKRLLGVDDDQEGGVRLGGRKLELLPAISKEVAQKRSSVSEKLGNALKKKRGKNGAEAEDRRNLWLAWEGRIGPEDDAAKELTAADIEKRRRAESEKASKLTSNPNVFVSKLRLSVRNLPLDVDEEQLRRLFAKSIGVSAKAVKQAKVVRDAERRTSAGDLRSRGYGFIEFERHEDALQALRAVNNNPKALSSFLSEEMREEWAHRRLIVEFALEDARKVRILERIKQKQLENHHKQVAEKQSDSAQNAGKEARRANKRRKQQLCSADDGERAAAKPKQRERRRETRSKRKFARKLATPATTTPPRVGCTDAATDAEPPEKKMSSGVVKGVVKAGAGRRRGEHPKSARVVSKTAAAKGSTRGSAVASGAKSTKRKTAANAAHVDNLDSLVQDYHRKLFKGNVARWYE